uniref:Uncharacterized protein n=1 Tax=Nicotiana tabacum TaxID=4097 RepID=A0A1S4ABI8_TOBAC|nr:PREDICTED: uncharacterized protein LOC107795788 [Nicotiana tabacum]
MRKYCRTCKKQWHNEQECWVMNPELHRRFDEEVEKDNKAKEIVGTAANTTKAKNNGLGDGVLMRLSPDGEDETSKPSKVKKRKKEALAESLKAETPKVRKPRTNAKVSTSAVVAIPYIEDEVCTNEPTAGDSRGLKPEASRGQDETLREINALGGFNLGHSYSPGEISDSQDQDTADIGASHRGEDVLKNLFDGVDEDIDLDAPIALEDAEMLQQQEIEKLILELKELKASSDPKREELSRLWANLKGVHRERTGLAKQIGQKDALVGLLREEVAAKDMKILELKEKKKARRMALEEASAKGTDLSTEIEKARDSEESSSFSTTSDESFGDDLESSDGEE